MTIDYSKLYNREALKGILAKYRKRILKEIDSVKDLTALLMIGTQRRWTKSELLLIKTHFIIIGKKIPILMVFLLPGGSILLPLLVEVLDRRKKNVPVSEEKRKFFKKNQQKRKKPSN
ncbi:MAG: hypothetical protein HY787_11800 [Deltaproteobacteria bacterium]|nr:hypothetical protein [Deltaproteobacteria bacterium]